MPDVNSECCRSSPTTAHTLNNFTTWRGIHQILWIESKLTKSWGVVGRRTHSDHPFCCLTWTYNGSANGDAIINAIT